MQLSFHSRSPTPEAYTTSYVSSINLHSLCFPMKCALCQYCMTLQYIQACKIVNLHFIIDHYIYSTKQHMEPLMNPTHKSGLGQLITYPSNAKRYECIMHVLHAICPRIQHVNESKDNVHENGTRAKSDRVHNFFEHQYIKKIYILLFSVKMIELSEN